MNIEWLAAWPQVGDAPDYLWQGEDCAYDGACFNTLRPVISMLWFSLPHRLGLPSTAILILHALLLFCSIALSVNIMIRLAGKSDRHLRIQQFICIFFSSAIHVVFLWPTFFYSLTDAPAALLILCGIFLLINLQVSTNKFRGIGYCLTGLVLGCAEGLRIFYLYPLLIFLPLYLGISLLAAKRDWRKLYLLSALLPVLLQNYATYSYSGEITHMPTSPRMTFWNNMHRSSTYTGYDTLIPEQGYPWFKSPCTVQQGLWSSLAKHEWLQSSCLIAGRLYFLLGSYSRHTYVEEIHIALGESGYIGSPESKGAANWKDPYSQGGVIIQAAPAPGENLWQFNIQVNLPQQPITFALTTQSEEVSKQLAMYITDADGHVLSEKSIPMTKEPTRHFLHANIPATGSYVITVAAEHLHPAPFIFQIGDLRLTPSNTEEAYPLAQEKVRYWSLLLLAVQAIVVVLYIVAAFKQARNNPEWLAIASLPLLIIAQVPIVIPEQRFGIAAEISLWLVALTTFVHYLFRSRCNKGPTPAHTVTRHQ